jgi:hypothetical protein
MAAAKKGKCFGRCGASSRHTTKLNQSIFFRYIWWHISAVSLPPSDVTDVTLAQLACPLNDIIVLLTYGINNVLLIYVIINHVQT